MLVSIAHPAGASCAGRPPERGTFGGPDGGVPCRRSTAVQTNAQSREMRGHLYRRILVAFVFLMTVVVVGTFGYHYIGEGRWALFDCFYMTVVTVSTVGFKETLPGISEVVGARVFTVVLIVLGSGTLLYFVSTLTGFVVEGDLFGALRRKRMQKRINEIRDHIVVCGVGSTGLYCIEELVATETPFVAVDVDEQRLLQLDDETGDAELLYVVGDATHDQTLERAGIARARGVIAALHEDKDNVYATITARALSTEARIVAKSVEAEADDKLRRAGADAIVSPNRIGGMRLVSEIVRPQVVEFLDTMVRDSKKSLRIEELPVTADGKLAGVQLRESPIRRIADALVIAVRRPDGDYLHNPGPSTELEPGSTLIILGATADIARLRAWLDGDAR